MASSRFGEWRARSPRRLVWTIRDRGGRRPRHGEEALERLAETAFDVVVSDLGMGAGMNGWELAEAVQKRWPGMRFLLATGWGAALDTGQARRLGVEAILSKPYQLLDLLEALARPEQQAA